MLGSARYVQTSLIDTLVVTMFHAVTLDRFKINRPLTSRVIKLQSNG